MTKILIADDHSDDRQLYRAILEASGHTVVEAPDGQTALEEAMRARPDLIISDVLMPKLDGFQLCRELQRNGDLRRIPFIFCSAIYVQPEHMALAAELGVRRFLLKPIDAAALRQAVEEALSEGPAKDPTVRLRQLDDRQFHSRHTAAVSETILEKVSELEVANALLKRQEKAFRELFEANPWPMWVYDLQSLRFLAVNDAAVNLYGWTRTEFLDMTIADIRPPEDIPRLLESVRATSAGVVQAGTWRHRLRDGRTIDVQIIGHRIEFDGHDAELVVARDITAQLRAERALAEHVVELEGMLSGTVATIMHLGELRDPYTAGHERRVGRLAAAIGRRLGFDDHRVRGLEIMGQLHDIGKISVPVETLVKPTRLTALEFELVKQHAAHGYEILRHVDFPWPVAEVARQHHERLDGSGYPRGLVGEQILPESRILAVADTVEAMSSHRPYRAALGLTEALAEIERGAGRTYDAPVVAACIDLVKGEDFVWDERL